MTHRETKLKEVSKRLSAAFMKFATTTKKTTYYFSDLGKAYAKIKNPKP